MGWTSLRGCSDDSIYSAQRLAILRRAPNAEYVNAPEYSSRPIRVCAIDDRFYLDMGASGVPGEVTVPAEQLVRYAVSTEGFLKALAKANEIKPDIDDYPSGLWRIGEVVYRGKPALVLLLPAGGVRELLTAIEDAHSSRHTDHTLLLAAGDPLLPEGTGARLQQMNVTLLPLPRYLHDDLSLDLPEAKASAMLAIDLTAHTAEWRGMPVKMGGGAFEILVALAKEAPSVVSHDDLRGPPGAQRSAESLRKTIHGLRAAFAIPASSRRDRVSSHAEGEIIQTAPGQGYFLGLSQSQIHIHH